MQSYTEFVNNTDLFITWGFPKIGRLAAKIAYYNFEWRFITMVMFNTVQAIGLGGFLQFYNKTVILKLGRFIIRNHRSSVRQFVIFGEDEKELSTTLNWIYKNKYDTNAKFILVCAARKHVCDEQIVFKTLIKCFILNVVLIKKINLYEDPEAYTYKIVSPQKCYNSVPDKVELTSNCPSEKCFRNLYPERLSNFYKCNLEMSTIEQPPFTRLQNGTKAPSGADGEIMKLAADMLNATLVFRKPSDGLNDCGHYINNNWTGSFGDIYNNRIHVSVCTVPLTSTKYGNFQISYPYYSMDIVWAAKLPPETAAWEKLIYPLKFQVRMLIIFMFIGVIVINTIKETNIWRKVSRVLRTGPSNYNLLFYSWLLFLGMPIHRVPSKRIFLIIMFMWIWCCFILRCAYQATLINALKDRAYYEELESMDDALKMNYPFGGPSYGREYYYDDNKHIYDNWILTGVNKTFELLDEILDGTTDFVLALNKEVINHYLLRFNGTKELQMIPRKIVNSPTVVYLKRYSPVTEPLTNVLRIAQEAGFTQKWYGRYLNYDKIHLRQYKTRGRRPAPLSLYHFAGSFAVLIVGWILSVIYFLIEYVCGNFVEDHNADNE